MELSNEVENNEESVFEEPTEETLISDNDAKEALSGNETEPPATEPDAWSPDYTFKVMDDIKEFDDFIRPIVNKDNQDKIRDLYERAHGLEHIKTKNQALKDENSRFLEMQQRYNAQNQALGHLGNLIEKKDWNSFFKELRIPDQEVMKYALDRVNYQDLSPEDKQVYDTNVETRQRLYNLEQQNLAYQKSMQEQAVLAKNQEIDQLLMSGPTRDIVESFDARAGRQGAFKDEVIRRGQLAYQQTGQDPTSQAVIDEVVKLYGPGVPAQGNPGGEVNTANTQTQQQIVSPTNKPVIPNVKSGGQSPTRKMPTSIEDLKKAAAAFD